MDEEISQLLRLPSVEKIRDFFNRWPLLTFCSVLQGKLASDSDSDEALELLETSIKSVPEIASALLSPPFADFAAAAAFGADERLQLLVLNAIETSSEISPMLLQMATERNSTVGVRAARLVGLRLNRGGLSSLLPILPELLILANPPTRDEVRMRIIEAVLIGSESSAEFFETVKADFISQIIRTFLGDDLLLKLNALELLERLGSFPSGKAFISHDSECMRVLEAELTDPDLKGSVALVMASVGRVDSARLWPTILGLIQSSQSEILLGLKSLTAIVAYPGGREKAKQDAVLVERLLLKIMDSSNEEVLKVVCDALGQVAGVIPIGHLIPKTCSLLLSKPFPEVRAHNWRAVTRMLYVMSAEQVAEVLLITNSPVMKLLNDFVSEAAYDSRVAKWEFVKALMGDAHLDRSVISTALGPQLTIRLSEYARGGFAWAPAQQAAVVVERMTS